MKNTIDKHELTDKQIDACKGIEKAFKLGLSFLAKQESICAYRTESLKHAVPLYQHSHGKRSLIIV